MGRGRRGGRGGGGGGGGKEMKDTEIGVCADLQSSA